MGTAANIALMLLPMLGGLGAGSLATGAILKLLGSTALRSGAKKAGVSALGRLAGTGLGSKAGQAVLKAKGAMPKAIQKGIPGSVEEAVASMGGMGQSAAVGLANMLAFPAGYSLLDFTTPEEVIDPSTLMPQGEPQSDVLAAVAGDVDTDLLDQNPELDRLISMILNRDNSGGGLV